MKRYGITKQIQLGDIGIDSIMGPQKSKIERRRDRKRARRFNRKFIMEDFSYADGR